MYVQFTSCVYGENQCFQKSLLLKKSLHQNRCRSIPREQFLRKVILSMCSKFTGEHPFRSVILIKLQSNFIEIALWHGCSPVNLLYIFGTPFPKNTSRRLLLYLKVSALTLFVKDKLSLKDKLLSNMESRR